MALLHLRGRVLHGVVLAAYGALASQGSGASGLVAVGAVGLAAVGYVASFVAELAGLRDLARDDGDVMLTTGERLHTRSLARIGRVSLVEGALLTVAAAPVAVTTALTSPTLLGASGVLFAAFLGVFELLLFAGNRQGAASREAFFAVRDRRPLDAIAALEGQDLRPAARWNDALLVAESWLMLGALERGLGVIAPHLGEPAVALRDAEWRVETDPSVARAVLAQAASESRLDRLRRLFDHFELF